MCSASEHGDAAVSNPTVTLRCVEERSQFCALKGMVQVGLIHSQTAFVCTTNLWCFLIYGMLWPVLEYKLESHLLFYIIPFGLGADVQQDFFFTF